MARHIQELLWEDKDQREYRAAKARFFRLLTILILILATIAALTISRL
jgi:hypothetical protein